MLKKIDIEKIVNIAKEAGDAIMQIYEKNFKIEYKDDSSPLTEADTKANEIICTALQKFYPNIPIMSEENKQISYELRKNWEYYWCVDPIDGTKEFIKKNGEFTVNIALIHKDTPILGVVYAPALDELYKAQKGKGAYKNNQKLPLHINNNPEKKLYVVASKSHLSKETQDFIDNINTQKVKQVSKGSSLKLCMVATGEADLYPRLAPTMEWDTAAADAIVRESGKMTYQFSSNEPIIYNKKNLLNPWFVVKQYKFYAKILKNLERNTKMKKKNQFRKAFTLVELLVVIVIIALLSSLVAPKFFGKLDTAKVKTANTQMQMLSQALDGFRLDVGRYPTTQEGLKILWEKDVNLKNWDGPYLPKAVKEDPWGYPYHYKSPGKNSEPYDLYHLGSDGKEGGSDDAKDISVWD